MTTLLFLAMCYLIPVLLNVGCRHRHFSEAIPSRSNERRKTRETIQEMTRLWLKVIRKVRSGAQRFGKHRRNECQLHQEYYDIKWADIVGQSPEADGKDNLVSCGIERIRLLGHKSIVLWTYLTTVIQERFSTGSNDLAAVQGNVPDEEETEQDFEEYMRLLREKYSVP